MGSSIFWVCFSGFMAMECWRMGHPGWAKAYACVSALHLGILVGLVMEGLA